MIYWLTMGIWIFNIMFFIVFPYGIYIISRDSLALNNYSPR